MIRLVVVSILLAIALVNLVEGQTTAATAGKEKGHKGGQCPDVKAFCDKPDDKAAYEKVQKKYDCFMVSHFLNI